MPVVRVYPELARTFASRSSISYAEAQLAANAISWNSSSAGGGQNLVGAQFRTELGYMAFDTAFLGSLGTVTAATFNTTFVTDNSTTDFTINVRAYDWGTELPAPTTHWRTPAELAALPLVATKDTSTPLTGTQTFATGSGSASSINTSGPTRLVVSSSRYESQTAPLGPEFVDVTPVNAYLEITYTANPVSPAVMPASSTTDNGALSSYSEQSYADARSGAGLTVVEQNEVAIAQSAGNFKGTLNWSIQQGFVRFDTSVLAGKTLTSATLEAFVMNASTPQDFTAEARLRSWGPTLETADFVPGADLGALPLLATLDTTPLAASVFAHVAFTSVNLLANINTTGFTDIVIASSRQRLSTPASTTAEELLQVSLMRLGVGYRLTVAFTTPAPTFTDTTVAPATTYFYRVTAQNSVGEGAQSASSAAVNVP